MQIANEKIEDYCRAHTTPLPEIFSRLRETTFRDAKMPQMQVGLLEGRFLAMLVAALRAKRVLEFGTFTGFSALAMAEALPDDGKLITCDVDPVATGIAKKFWAESPHGKKIELRLGPALETVSKLNETFDFIFVDADKVNYVQYWEKSIPLLRQGGLIAVDNVLWSGAVLNPQ
ncbi:MAG TPA: class I SAM-dependent methyltransferase, partial [Bdellovibrionota bacterium]